MAEDSDPLGRIPIPVPLLALPAGSLLQFAAVTLPLLVLYAYFLYLIATRPDEVYSLDDRIRLMDILYCYLVTFVLFASLAVYLAWFVRKRRGLIRRYRRDAIIVLGDVEYGENASYRGLCGCWLARKLFPLGGGDYGHALYDLKKVASHPACAESNPEKMTGMIRKKVRVFHRYPREQISIMVLPDYPYSGQPKFDLEADWASFSEEVGEIDATENVEDAPVVEVLKRDRIMGLLIICAFWVSFCFFAAMYACFQIAAVEDYYVDESADWAWIMFAVFTMGVMPLVSIVGNWIRWKQYERWMLRSGTKVGAGEKAKKKDAAKNGNGTEAAAASGSYIQMV